MRFSWEDIAKELGGTKADIRELKKKANVETGVRHASKSGVKLRANPHKYGTWVAGLFDLINTARERVEPGYVSVAGEEGGRMISRAIPHVPFE